MITRRTRGTHTPGFQAKVALAAIKGEKTLAELAQQHDVHPSQITSWKTQLLEGATGAFGSGSSAIEATPAVGLKGLHVKIGELTLENEFSAGALSHVDNHATHKHPKVKAWLARHPRRAFISRRPRDRG